MLENLAIHHAHRAGGGASHGHNRGHQRRVFVAEHGGVSCRIVFSRGAGGRGIACVFRCDFCFRVCFHVPTFCPLCCYYSWRLSKCSACRVVVHVYYCDAFLYMPFFAMMRGTPSDSPRPTLLPLDVHVFVFRHPVLLLYIYFLFLVNRRGYHTYRGTLFSPS